MILFSTDVNALATNLELNRLDEGMTQPVNPTETIGNSGGTGDWDSDVGQSNLKVSTMDQITITGDGGSHFLAPIAQTVEGLLDGLHGKVGVTAVYNLEKGDLRVSCQVDILSAIGYELHQQGASRLAKPGSLPLTPLFDIIFVLFFCVLCFFYFFKTKGI